MASVFDVAAHMLRKQGPMTAMKLQKLTYYCQAWSLVWDGRPIFDEEIRAWANGPVIRELFWAHRGMFSVEAKDLAKGNPSNLDKDAIETIDAVLGFYGEKSPQWLSDLTHMEDPWRKAYGERPAGTYCDEPISLASMAEYYEALA